MHFFVAKASPSVVLDHLVPWIRVFRVAALDCVLQCVESFVAPIWLWKIIDNGHVGSGSSVDAENTIEVEEGWACC